MHAAPGARRIGRGCIGNTSASQLGWPVFMFRAAAIVRREARRAAGARRWSGAHTRCAGYTIDCGDTIECGGSSSSARNASHRRESPGLGWLRGCHRRRAGEDGGLGDGEGTLDAGGLDLAATGGRGGDGGQCLEAVGHGGGRPRRGMSQRGGWRDGRAVRGGELSAGSNAWT